MNPEIEKAIELIDQKIMGLQKAKLTLLEAFGEKSEDIKHQASLFPVIKRNTVKKSTPTRREELAEFLKLEGPLTRTEIFKRSGIPQGTVSTLLLDKATFKSKDGKWYAIQKEQMHSESSPDMR
jgi:hypothetical protein